MRGGSLKQRAPAATKGSDMIGALEKADSMNYGGLIRGCWKWFISPQNMATQPRSPPPSRGHNPVPLLRLLGEETPTDPRTTCILYSEGRGRWSFGKSLCLQRVEKKGIDQQKKKCVMFVWLWTDAWLGTAALSPGSEHTGHPLGWCIFTLVPRAGVCTLAIPCRPPGGRSKEDGIKQHKPPNVQNDCCCIKWY